MTNRIELFLPFPPSVNRIYRVNYRSKSLHISKEGKKFKDSVDEIIQSDAGTSDLYYSHCENLTLPLISPIKLEIDLIPRDRRLWDIDNRAKFLIDCLEGYFFKNDNQIIELIIRKLPFNKEKAGCKCTISEAEQQ
jgi:Holliday junction resolvase RusA-like endonuclease